MPDSSQGTLSVEIVDSLRKHWIPQLRGIKDQRETTCKIMRLILVTSVVLCFVLAAVLIYQIWTEGELVLNISIILTVALGPATLCFAYLAKLQRCNDLLVGIEFFVHMRDRKRLIEALENIDCLGGMKGIIHDAAGLFRSEPS